MDLLQIIFLWLKSFIEAMKRITSFVGGSYLPDEKPGEDDTNSFDKLSKK